MDSSVHRWPRLTVMCSVFVALRRRLVLVVVAAMAVLGGSLALAGASASADTLGAVTELSAGITEGSGLGAITASPDGNLWFTEEFGNGRIGRITPAGEVTEFPTPTHESVPQGITAGPDGNLWFTEFQGNRIGRITPTGEITEFSTGISEGSGPNGIVAGPDGNLWFTEQQRGQIGRITPTGEITEFSKGITPESGPTGITAGPDGNLWFTEEFGNGGIGRITPAGVVTEFSTGITPGSRPYEIAAGPDGNLWFTEESGARIGRITRTGEVTEFGITEGSRPAGIAAGPDGNLWFTEFNGNRIGRITPAGVVTEFSTGISPESFPNKIVAGPDGNLWFTEYFGNRIGRIGAGVAQHGHHTGRPLAGTTTSTSSFAFFAVSKGTTDGTGYFSHLGKITFHRHYTAFTFTGSNSFTDAGTETDVAANGDKLFAEFTTRGTFTRAGEVGSTVKTTTVETIIGGTGRFAGASGTLTATTTSVITSVVFGVEATTSDTSTYAGEIAY